MPLCSLEVLSNVNGTLNKLHMRRHNTCDVSYHRVDGCGRDPRSDDTVGSLPGLKTLSYTSHKTIDTSVCSNLMKYKKNNSVAYIFTFKDVLSFADGALHGVSSNRTEVKYLDSSPTALLLSTQRQDSFFWQRLIWHRGKSFLFLWQIIFKESYRFKYGIWFPEFIEYYRKFTVVCS